MAFGPSSTCFSGLERPLLRCNSSFRVKNLFPDSSSTEYRLYHACGILFRHLPALVLNTKLSCTHKRFSGASRGVGERGSSSVWPLSPHWNNGGCSSCERQPLLTMMQHNFTPTVLAEEVKGPDMTSGAWLDCTRYCTPFNCIVAFDPRCTHCLLQ